MLSWFQSLFCSNERIEEDLNFSQLDQTFTNYSEPTCSKSTFELKAQISDLQSIPQDPELNIAIHSDEELQMNQKYNTINISSEQHHHQQPPFIGHQNQLRTQSSAKRPQRTKLWLQGADLRANQRNGSPSTFNKRRWCHGAVVRLQAGKGSSIWRGVYNLRPLKLRS